MPDPGDTKAGDHGQGTSSSSGTKSSGSGNSSGVGGGGGGGGGSTGTRGSSSGSVGAGNGSNAPGNGGGSDHGGSSGQGNGGSHPAGGNGTPSGGGNSSPGSSPGTGAGGQRGAGSNYGPGSGQPNTQTGGGNKTGGGNTTGVGGPGGGGMGADNARNGSSTSDVGPGSGYSAPGNIGGGRDTYTGQMKQGTSPSVAKSNDRFDGMKTQMDTAFSRDPMMTRNPGPSAAQMAQQYSQYRAPPGAAPPTDDFRAPATGYARPDDFRAPPNDISRISQSSLPSSLSSSPLGPDDFRAPPGPQSTADLWGRTPMDPSIPGRNLASEHYYDKYNLRGLTGPLGEPRTQVTPHLTNYQTAQMARSMYPDTIGKYSQPRVNNAFDTLTKAYPGEADVNKYGNVSDVMNDLARVSLNQMVGGYGPDKAMSALDTTGMRQATRGFQNPGPKSMGMTDNWADPVAGSAAQVRAAGALQDALFNRGVDPAAANASNFVSAGTRLPNGISPSGSPINGTQYGNDTTWGTKIADRNAAARAPGLTSGSMQSGAGVYAGGLSSVADVRPASDSLSGVSGPDDFRSPGGAYSHTYPASNFGPTDYQRDTTVNGGLGIQGYNAPQGSNPNVISGGTMKHPDVRDGRLYGGSYNAPDVASASSSALGPDDFRAPPSSTPQRPSALGPDDFRAPPTPNTGYVNQNPTSQQYSQAFNDIYGPPVQDSVASIDDFRARPTPPNTYGRIAGGDVRMNGSYPSPPSAIASAASPDDFRAPQNSATPTSDGERVLSVENVPPDPTSPSPSQEEYKPHPVAPSQYDPPHHIATSIGGSLIDGIISVLPGGSMVKQGSKMANQGLSPGNLFTRDADGYMGLTPEEKAAYDDRANQRRADQFNRENSHNERPQNAYIPQGAAPPPPPSPPGTPGTTGTPGVPPPTTDPNGWTLRKRLGMPDDPYNYGYGPAHSYFYYG